MVDPTSLAIATGKVVVSKAAASAGGKFVEKIYNDTSKWIKEKFKLHKKEVQKKAQKNANSFLKETGKQLQVIVNASKNSQVTLQLIDKNFRDPDFTALLHQTTLAAARTNLEDRHRLFARIIAERVSAEPEDIVSLVSTTAIDAIGKISRNQLFFLSLAALVYGIRPDDLPKTAQEIKLEKIAKDWWTRHLSVILPKLSEMKEIDISHLISVSCLDYMRIGSRSLNGLLTAGFGKWETREFLVNTKEGRLLDKVFKERLQRVTLTSTGQLIGIYVHDHLMGKRTSIDW